MYLHGIKYQVPGTIQLKWVVFDEYAVKIQTFYLNEASDLDQRNIYIDNEKTGTIEDEETFGSSCRLNTR